MRCTPILIILLVLDAGCMSTDVVQRYAVGWRLAGDDPRPDPLAQKGNEVRAPDEWVLVQHVVWRTARWAHGGNDDTLSMELRAPVAGRQYILPSDDARANYSSVRFEEFYANAKNCTGTVRVERLEDGKLILDIDLALDGEIEEVREGHAVVVRSETKPFRGRYTFERDGDPPQSP